jgi:uncharacterized protein DUF6851/vanadium-dependent haloperoxidase-like protein
MQRKEQVKVVLGKVWVCMKNIYAAETKEAPGRLGMVLFAKKPLRALVLLVLGAQILPLGARAEPPANNVVITWNRVALQGVRDAGGQHAPSKMGPPMVARALAIIHTCIYDAWAAYDDVAFGTRALELRRPAVERTEANIVEAMSFAAYRALADLMPVDAPLYRQTMTDLGYDYTNETTDTTTPAGIGNVACHAVLEYRHQDGSNQLGDLHPGAYSDYTGYTPVNDPMDASKPIDLSTVHDPNRWQPLRYVDQNNTLVTPKAVGAFWTRVTPFALDSSAELRSATGPARYGSPEYLLQVLQTLAISATLTDEQKVISEYWADGPNSELPPGHWNVLAQFVSARDHHTVQQDVKMFFMLTNAIFDAGIVAWDNKDTFDSVRPITAVRYLFNGIKVLAWGGPGKGTQLIDGGAWMPYQPNYFPSPPFPEYSSGHSNFSAAGAEILKRFTGSDTFGASLTIPAGSSAIEPGMTPAQDVTLTWPTFTSAADQAGMSRRYGGIHFEQGDLDARSTGRLAAAKAWTTSQLLFADANSD